MTNEELGRKWAESHGKRPYETEYGCYGWQTDKWSSRPHHSLPAFLHSLASGHFSSREDAYEILGRAIRAVMEFADAARYLYEKPVVTT